MDNDVPAPLGAIELDMISVNAARSMRALYLAYVQVGFTEDQALELIKTTIASAGKPSA